MCHGGIGIPPGDFWKVLDFRQHPFSVTFMCIYLISLLTDRPESPESPESLAGSLEKAGATHWPVSTCRIREGSRTPLKEVS